MTLIVSALAILLAAAPAAAPADVAADDPYLWLEEVQGEKAIAWVRARNERSVARLEKDERHAPTEKAIRDIALAPDRVPDPSIRGSWVYNFWQDEKSVRGVWRRTSLEEYARESPKWDVLLDVDALAEREGENWVYKGSGCLPPEHRQCLVHLSRGGKDATTVREFDIEKREFVAGGFELPEAKSRIAWIDRDTVFVGTDFGPGSLTTSGYPRLVKVWKRGTPLEQAVLVLEGDVKDVWANGSVYFRPEGNVAVVSRAPAFFKQQSHLWEGGKLREIPFPLDAGLQGAWRGRLFARLRTDWKVGERTFARGSLLALPLDSLDVSRLESVLEPTEKTSIRGMVFSATAAYVSLLEDVSGKIVEVRRGDDGAWTALPQRYPEHGSVGFVSAYPFDDTTVVSYSSYLVPSTLYLSRAPGDEPKVLKRSPERFDTAGLMTERHFATSRDGTRIPYFVVRPKTTAPGGAPTILYGYGGFESALTPGYLSATGKWWLEKGGVYVVANIRGGGEYGPRWHEAALKENRARAYDDFIAVAEDVVARRIAAPGRLGIKGWSNGGLLVGATFTRRPDLFAAVSCGAPLLDMLRYHKLPPGGSWMAEYGDPDDPKLHDVIRAYSPYHNLAPKKKYPEVLFLASTGDDRVHPGHARKMAARMEEMGHPFLYFENIEGGHGAAANLNQLVRRSALEAVYFYQKLMDGK